MYNAWEMQRWMESYCLLSSFGFLSIQTHTHTRTLGCAPHLTAFRWHHFIKSCSDHGVFCSHRARKSEKSHLPCYVVISCYAINVCLFVFQMRSCCVCVSLHQTFLRIYYWDYFPLEFYVLLAAENENEWKSPADFTRIVCAMHTHSN